MKVQKGTPEQVTDFNTNFYVSECRRPNVGEYVLLPGPMWQVILTERHPLRDQDCTVLVGILRRNEEDPTLFSIIRLDPITGPTMVDVETMRKLWFHGTG